MRELKTPRGLRKEKEEKAEEDKWKGNSFSRRLDDDSLSESISSYDSRGRKKLKRITVVLKVSPELNLGF